MTPTLESCPPTRIDNDLQQLPPCGGTAKVESRAAGYTLIELLVVLALIGLATSVALPAFFRWTSGAEAHADENLVLTELSGLGFRAWAAGQPVVLDNEHARAVLRRLPTSWQTRIAQPIVFASSGTCTGGAIAFVDGAGLRRAFRLAPLTCDVRPE